MQYKVTQAFMAFGDDFSVQDQSGREVFYFDGKLFNFGGRKIRVLNEQKREVGRLAQKLFAFSPTYRVIRNGIVAAQIKRKRSVREKYIIDVPGTNDYEIVGDVVGHEYTIRRGSQEVARISKKFFGATDSYGVEVNGGDAFLMLSAVVVIDMIRFRGRKSA